MQSHKLISEVKKAPFLICVPSPYYYFHFLIPSEAGDIAPVGNRILN